MREKFMWLVIGALLLITVHHACGNRRHTAAATDLPGQPLRPDREGAYAARAADSQWAELQKWRGRVSERVGRGEPLLPPDFDAVFGDAFFAGRRDPFADLETIRRQTADGLSGPGKGLFERNWAAWFGQRMRMGEFAATVRTSADAVTLEVKVPGLVPGTAAADVTPERIRLTFTVRTSAALSGSGGMLRKESSRSYTKVLPVPDGADPAGARTEASPDAIKLRFARKAR